MSYAVELLLYAEYTRENVQKIITCAVKKGNAFYNTELDKILSIDQALNFIFTPSDELELFGPRLCMKLEEEEFFLFFWNENNVIDIYLSLPDVPEKINYDDFAYIDFARYIRIALDLVEDFPIQKMKTIAY